VGADISGPSAEHSELEDSPPLGVEDCSELGHSLGLRVGGCSALRDRCTGRIVLSLGDRRACGWGGCFALGDSLRREDCSELRGLPGLGVGDCSDLGDSPGLRIGGCSPLGDSLRREDCSEHGGSPGLRVRDCSTLKDSAGKHVASPVVYGECPLGEPLGLVQE